jgi:two-component system response regulator EvgA
LDLAPFDEALIVDVRPAPHGEASWQIVHALGAGRTLLADNVRLARQMVRDRQPGLVVIELDTLGQAGILLIKRLAAGHPTVRLLVLSDSDATMAPVQAPRELTVLQFLARGHTNKAIATRLLISSKTVSTHKTNVMCKLNVGSVVEMVDYARQHQLL